MVRISSITADYTENPIGITQNPGFSWKIEGDSQNIKQKSYLLEISHDKDFADIVITQTEDSDASVNVYVSDLKLESLTDYYCRVDVTLENGEQSEYSAPCHFVTALIGNDEWKGDFISAESEADAGNSKGTYLRREFEVSGKVRSAYLLSTALGLYNAYIDGKKVGNDELTPGWTSYKKHLCYQMNDVTGFFENSKENGGRHCITAHLGAGYYKGTMGFLMMRNNYGKQTAFLGELHILYEDGRSEVIATDNSWMGTDSPVIFSEIYDGEIYDARKEIPGLKMPGYADEHKLLRNVEKVDFDKNVLISQPCCRVREKTALPAKSIFTTPQGDTVIDFAQNHAGWIHIIIDNAKAGDEVELDCFESLDAAGNVYTDNLRGAKNRFVYTCIGSGHEEYHPVFTYQGYRYAKVVSWAGDELTTDRVCAYAVYSDMEKTGDFTCSDKNINRLWENITWSLRSNFVDIPTDCPQRNERVGWTGDAQIFCRTASYIMNTYNFFDKWLTDVACDQTKEGGVPHVVPDIITPYIDVVNDWLCSQGTHSAAAWADVAVLNPWNLYLTYGNKEILKKQYGSMKKWIDFMREHADGIIWNYRLQFGDWVALDAEEGSYFGATPNDLTCTAYYYLSTQTFSRIASILGNKDDAKEYGSLAEKIKEGFISRFFDSNTKGMTVMTQTAHIVALYFGLTPGEYKKQTVKELLKLLKEHDGHLVTGFVGTPYFTHALSQNGCLKEAYDLLLKDDFPSWLYQVKQGATTVWEHWDGLKPDGTMWSADMNSFNHYAYGSIGEWLIRVAAGIEIDADDPGYHHIIFSPRPGGGLRFARGKYESLYGLIESGWTVDGNTVTYEFTVPANTTAYVNLSNIADVINVPRNMEYSLSGDVFTSSVGSGKYKIEVTICS